MHSQSGMVERDIDFVMDRARICMAQYNTPSQYWGWAVLYAVYTINHTHVPKSTVKTPWELVYKTVLSVANLILESINSPERSGR
jgi:hypothetical protein